MKRTIILTTAILISTLAFTQVAINKDGSEPGANSILHVKGSGVNALYVDYATGYIGINSIIPSYRLHLVESVTDTKNYGAVYEITGGSTASEKYAGVYSYIAGTDGINRAFEGLSYGVNPTNYNIGITGLASNAKFNFGIQGLSIQTNSVAQGLNVGGKFDAENCDNQNIGIWSIAHGGATYNTGVYAVSNENNSGINYGIWAAGANNGSGDYWSGYFDGKINVVGDIYHNGTSIHSKSISTIDNACDEVMKFKPVSYLNNDDELLFGFDTETMKTTYPELVKEVTQPPAPGEESGSIETSTSVNISAVIPLLTKAIQELNEKVENLESENSLLKKEINELKSK